MSGRKIEILQREMTHALNLYEDLLKEHGSSPFEFNEWSNSNGYLNPALDYQYGPQTDQTPYHTDDEEFQDAQGEEVYDQDVDVSKNFYTNGTNAFKGIKSGKNVRGNNQIHPGIKLMSQNLNYRTSFSKDSHPDQWKKLNSSNVRSKNNRTNKSQNVLKEGYTKQMLKQSKTDVAKLKNSFKPLGDLLNDNYLKMKKIEGEWRINNSLKGNMQIKMLQSGDIQIIGNEDGIRWTVNADLGSKGAIQADFRQNSGTGFINRGYYDMNDQIIWINGDSWNKVTNISKDIKSLVH